MIRIEHLKKTYANGFSPFTDVNTHIGKGEVVSVIGPSGAGKSTLLRCINLLEKPTSGRIYICGEEITAPDCDETKVRRKMGMVFQHFNLFGHMTVIENVMYGPLRLLKKSKQEAYDEAIRLLGEVGMAGYALNYPDELSGGQRQRAAIARTLAMDPEIILFDEPTSALDPTMAGEVEAVIRELSSTEKTMMIVTHEMEFARSICSRVFYMDEGCIYEDGTPEQIFDNPIRENTRRFIKRLSVLELLFEGNSIDFYDAGTKVRRYCTRHQIPYRQSYHIMLVIEEMVQEILLPVLKDPRIHVVVEYNEHNNEVSVEIRYNGPAKDPADSENALSYKLLKGTVAELEYSPIEEDIYQNLVRVSIR